MKILRFLLFVLMLPVACAGLPDIRQSADPSATQDDAACMGIFPKGQWQFAHAIQAKPPGGSQQTMIGVIRMSPEERTFECVMMTLEGITLFEARYDGAVIDIQKAVPPMDTPGVAEGMIADILLVFFAPEARPMSMGTLSDHAKVCRYPVKDQGIQDIIVQPDGRWEMRQYGANKRLTRTIITDGSEISHPQGFPSRIELKASGLAGYQLKMNLMEAVPLDNEPDESASN